MARNPTAQTSVAESAETAPRLLLTPVKVGLETTLQLGDLATHGQT